MKKKITLAVLSVALVALIVSAVVYLTGHQKLDWELYGNYISQDG